MASKRVEPALRLRLTPLHLRPSPEHSHDYAFDSLPLRFDRRCGAAALLTIYLGAANAQSEASAFSALSALPIAVSVAAPVMFFSASVTLVTFAAAAHVGRSGENKPPAVDAIQRSIALAEHTARQLDQSGAQVVVLARMGQNLAEHNVRYSHLGMAYRDDDGKWREGGKGPVVWRVVHKLNQCRTSHAALYRQGLGEFFLDDLYRYEAAVVIPKPGVQAKLLPMLKDHARLAQLNTPADSMVAYPWSTTYQQSNQWAIETFAMTQEPAAQTRKRAQAWLQLQGYQPTTLHIPALKRLGGRITAANIAFDDHPNEKRFEGRIETVTVDSVFAWLKRAGLGGPVQVIR